MTVDSCDLTSQIKFNDINYKPATSHLDNVCNKKIRGQFMEKNRNFLKNKKNYIYLLIIKKICCLYVEQSDIFFNFFFL